MIAAGACDSFLVDPNINLTNDIVMASADYFLPAGWSVTARVEEALLDQDLEIVVCNDTFAGFDPSNAVTFTWAVLQS